ncbi:MAG TPA: XdhC family protein [Gammaproteobacteria bacterium]|nr:XdhC family protein [Gammaproteobacteria bacterium]
MRDPVFDVLDEAVRWLAEGRAATLVTVLRTWGSSPRPPASVMALRDDGLVSGSVSGGCVEDDLQERLRGGPPRGIETLGYGGRDEERVRLPCGARLELLLEPLHEAGRIAPARDALAQRRPVRRRLETATGRVAFELPDAVAPVAAVEQDGDCVTVTWGPQWRLLLIGCNDLARYLADMAQAVGFEVLVCDPRQDGPAWQPGGARRVAGMPDDAVRQWAADGRSAVVALSHDPRLDDLALLEALDSEAFYVGALGSRANNERRRERLATLGLSAAALARLHGPVGLPIGSRTPAEIAVSVLAELLQVRSAVPAAAPGRTADRP